jgi:hypothetical protein
MYTENEDTCRPQKRPSVRVYYSRYLFRQQTTHNEIAPIRMLTPSSQNFST